MQMPRCAPLFVFLVFMGCESPHDKISRLQGELLTALGERDYFEIVAEKQKIRLPLPPAPELAAARKVKISEINLETYSMDSKKLNAEDQQRLQDLCGYLNQIVQRGNGAFFDPTKFVLAEVLSAQQTTGATEQILQKMPEYYAEVERRWQTPDPARAQVAAEQSIRVLEQLEKMGDRALSARLAVKDFMGLCHSAVLMQ